MKKKLLLFLFSLLTVLPTMASEYVIINGIRYYLNPTTQTAEVTRGGDYFGDITIPATVTYEGVTYPVTVLQSDVFTRCKDLKSVVLPNSLDIIESGVFNGCSGLTRVIIPNSVKEIRTGAFLDCSSLTSIDIPNSVVSIGPNAFLNSGIYNNSTDGVFYVGKFACGYKGDMPASITVKEGVEYIADRAFSSSENLTSVTLPSSLKIIESGAFSGCKSLTSVTIPSSVTSIGNNAFARCSSLNNIILPNGLKIIGDCAFLNCANLTSVTFPKNPILIGNVAFEGTSINPNSVSWPVPVYKTEWEKNPLGKEVVIMYRIIKWGDKEYMLSWNKNQNLYYCADLPSLTFYSNYNDLEAAVFYWVCSHNLRSKGIIKNNGSRSNGSRSNGKSKRR